MSDGPFWSEIGLIMQKLSEADRVTLIQHQRKSEDAVRAEALDMGRRMEREAIVAWLEDIRYGMAGRESEWTRFLAMRIANGDHKENHG